MNNCLKKDKSPLDNIHRYIYHKEAKDSMDCRTGNVLVQKFTKE